MNFHRPSAATVIATTALVVAVGGGTAFAATQMVPDNSVGTAQLKNGAVTNAKVKQYSLSADRFSRAARNELSGSTTINVTKLGRTWKNHSDGTDGNATIDANGAELGGTGQNGGLASGNDYAGIATTVLNHLTPADLSTITYTESYTMPGDSHYAAPYFKLKLQPGNASTCGNDDVVYNPSVQKDNLDYADETETFNVTAPYSTVGVNNDANPIDGTYPVAIHSTSNGATKDVSGERICLAEIILGGGSAADDAKATINDVTFAGAGLPTRTYTFASND